MPTHAGLISTHTSAKEEEEDISKFEWKELTLSHR